jgi:hypothetical protein
LTNERGGNHITGTWAPEHLEGFPRKESGTLPELRARRNAYERKAIEARFVRELAQSMQSNPKESKHLAEESGRITWQK